MKKAAIAIIVVLLIGAVAYAVYQLLHPVIIDGPEMERDSTEYMTEELPDSTIVLDQD